MTTYLLVLLAFGAIALFSACPLQAQVSSCIGADNCEDQIKYIPQDASPACSLLQACASEPPCLCFDTEDICIKPGEGTVNRDGSSCSWHYLSNFSIGSSCGGVTFEVDDSNDALLQLDILGNSSEYFERMVTVMNSETLVGQCKIQFPPFLDERFASGLSYDGLDFKYSWYPAYYCGDCIDLCSSNNNKLKFWVNMLKNCTCDEFNEDQKIYYNLYPMINGVNDAPLKVFNSIDDIENWPYIELSDISEEGNFCLDCIKPYGFARHGNSFNTNTNTPLYYACIIDENYELVQDENNLALRMYNYSKYYFDEVEVLLANDCGCIAHLYLSLRENTESIDLEANIQSVAACSRSSETGRLRFRNYASLPEGATFRWKRTSPSEHLYDVNDPDIEELVYGNYELLLNYRGCESVLATSRVGELAVDFRPSVKNASCSSSSDGEITLETRRGVPSFTYVWDPNVSTSHTATGLAPGSYSVTVTDSRGCSKTQSGIQVGFDSELVLSVQQRDASCNGGSDGRLQVQASGGTGAHTFVWDPEPAPPPAFANVLENLAAGSYSVTATDMLGCTATATYTVTEPPELEAELTASPETTITCPCGVTLLMSAGEVPVLAEFPPSTTIYDAVTYVLERLDGSEWKQESVFTLPSAPGVDPNALVIPRRNVQKAGQYRLRIITSRGCEMISDPVTLEGATDPAYARELLLRCPDCSDPCPVE